MQYKGYHARIEFDEDDETFHGEVAGIRDVVTFEGDSVAELRRAFRDSVEDYLEFCRERGERPEKPHSGRFVVRVSSHLHRKLSTAADLAGESLNSWIAQHLESEVDAFLAERASPPKPRRRPAAAKHGGRTARRT